MNANWMKREIARLNRRIEIAETVSGEAYDLLDTKDKELADLYSAIHWGKVAHKRMTQEIAKLRETATTTDAVIAEYYRRDLDRLAEIARLRQALQTIADTAYGTDVRELARTALEHSDR